uniref:Uncharacterized protein n=1 Tax=Romanomermis culicivorax TaxID=13658 RepID=A0A915L5Z9_ROMCU
MQGADLMPLASTIYAIYERLVFDMIVFKVLKLMPKIFLLVDLAPADVADVDGAGAIVEEGDGLISCDAKKQKWTF